jgi:hypothetical protein
MAYFPNGTAGLGFVETTCVDCVHWKDDGDGRGHGCPVYDVHLLFSTDLCNKKDDPGKVILDTLIEPDFTCTMFHGHGRDTRTLPLFHDEATR